MTDEVFDIAALHFNCYHSVGVWFNLYDKLQIVYSL